MTSIFKRAAVAIAVAGVAVGTVVAAPVAVSQVRTAPTGIQWGVCDDAGLQELKAECGMLSVPLDYRSPSGTKIRLAVSRVKHAVPDSKYQGVMFVNPGGPGGSGLGLVSISQYVPKDAGAAYDWIGFDPRGVGSSEPRVSCDPYYLGFNRPKYVPTTAKIERAWKARTNAYTRDCAALNGDLLNHLTTLDSARDMDSIRKALGANQINYYGFSYGTYLGQVYATKYPQRLRRVVFDSTVDPRAVWYKVNLNQDRAFDKNMNIWFGWLAKYDSVYHLGKTRAAVRKLFYATQTRLDKQPAQGQLGRLGGSEWNDTFIFSAYSQWTWIGLGAVFSGYVNDRDIAALESAYLDVSGYGDDNGYALYLGVECTDTAWPVSWKKWQRDNWRIYAKAPYLTWGNAWYNEPCRHWPAAPHKKVKVDGKTVASLLMIDQTLDAATPYPGSIEVRRRFPNGRLIAEPGGTTHSGSLSGNACVDDRIADYLLTGALPKRLPGNRADVECAPLPQPDPTAVSKLTADPKRTSREELQKLLMRR